MARHSRASARTRRQQAGEAAVEAVVAAAAPRRTRHGGRQRTCCRGARELVRQWHGSVLQRAVPRPEPAGTHLRSRHRTWPRSTDGGATSSNTNWESKGVHVDHHAMAFDPLDKNHILLGNDGGLYETYDFGETWKFHATLPVTQYTASGVTTPSRSTTCAAARRTTSRSADRHAPPTLGHPQQRLVQHRGWRRVPGARHMEDQYTSSRVAERRLQRASTCDGPRPGHSADDGVGGRR